MLRRWGPVFRWSVSLLSGVFVLAAAVPPAAAGHGASFRPPQTLTTGGDLIGRPAVQATTGADGRVRGFVSAGFPVSRISWFEGRGSSWRVEQTPYQGYVTATAHDQTGTYLLLETPQHGLRIVKRQISGQYTSGHELHPAQNPTDPAALVGLYGDLVARDGRWWAVWGLRGPSEHDMELMEASTFGGTHVRRRVTGSAAVDWWPTLALGAGASPTAYLVWVRAGSLWSAVATRPGDWRQSRQLGGRGDGPDLVVADGVLHLTWQRGNNVWYGRGTASRMTSQRISNEITAYEGGRLAVSRDHTWIVFGTAPRVLLATRQTARSAWRTSVLLPNAWDVQQVSITAVNGRATAFVSDWRAGRVVVRAQEP